MRVAIKQDIVAEHLRDYFNCMHQFFKELALVSGPFHDSHGGSLNSIVTKALRCLNMLAQIGMLGSFDFAKLFLQRNCLRTLLQAKVMDSDYQIELDIWRLNKKPDQSPFHNSGLEAR